MATRRDLRDRHSYLSAAWTVRLSPEGRKFEIRNFLNMMDVRSCSACQRFYADLFGNIHVTHHVGVSSCPKACHITLFFVDNDFWSTLSTIPSHLCFILDSESRQVIFFFLPTYPPLTIGRVGPLGTGFIRPHPHRPFALEIGSSHEPSPTPQNTTTVNIPMRAVSTMKTDEILVHRIDQLYSVLRICGYFRCQDIIVPRDRLVFYVCVAEMATTYRPGNFDNLYQEKGSTLNFSPEQTAEAVEEFHALSQNLQIIQEDLTDVQDRIQYLFGVHQRLLQFSSQTDDLTVLDSLEYLLSKSSKMKRWAKNYAERTGIRINLIYNLATQADSRTNLEIARLSSRIAVSTQQDSSSMITCVDVYSRSINLSHKMILESQL
jgi:hypothetical protein